MAQFIDRRLNPRDKSLGNRQRFLRRTRAEVKRAVDKAVAERAIADAGEGGSVSIPTDGIGEPQFHLSRDSGGREFVLPGNKEFVAGDRIDKPKGGGGGGGAGRKASDSGERRGRLLLRAHRSRIPRHPVRGPRTARSRQGLAEGRERARIPAGRLFQRRHDAQSHRAAHDARQHEPASGAAPSDHRRGRAARGGARSAARQGPSPEVADQLRIASSSPRSSGSSACSAPSPSSIRSTCATTASRR